MEKQQIIELAQTLNFIVDYDKYDDKDIGRYFLDFLVDIIYNIFWFTTLYHQFLNHVRTEIGAALKVN